MSTLLNPIKRGMVVDSCHSSFLNRWQERRSAMTTTQEVHRIEVQMAIEYYILGRLTQEEIDQLWVEFLKAPKWFNYFITLLHLYSTMKKRGIT